MLKLFFIILLTFCSVTFAQLSCYDCDPRSSGNCSSPESNDIAVTNCTETISSNTTVGNIIDKINDNSTESAFCYYLYFDAGVEEQTGYYRGCSKNSNGVSHFCQALATYMQKNEVNSKMTGCKCCNSPNCNSGTFGNTEIKISRIKNEATTKCNTFSLLLLLYLVLSVSNIILTH